MINTQPSNRFIICTTVISTKNSLSICAKVGEQSIVANTACKIFAVSAGSGKTIGTVYVTTEVVIIQMICYQAATMIIQ